MSQEPHYANKIMKGKKNIILLLQLIQKTLRWKYSFLAPKKEKKKKDTFMKASVTWTLHFYQMLLCWTLQHDTTLGHMCPAARIYDEGKEN